MNTILSRTPALSLGTREGLLCQSVRLDAVVSGAVGVALMAAGGEPLGNALGIPSALLRAVGGVCVVYAAALWLLQTREPIPRAACWLVIAGNSAWVAASLVSLVFGWLALTPLGVGLVVLQALAVAALADLQLVALLRARSSLDVRRIGKVGR